MHQDTLKYNEQLEPDDKAVCDLLAEQIDHEGGGPKVQGCVGLLHRSLVREHGRPATLACEARKIQWDYRNVVRRKGRLERLR
jgi:hypothetical protein